MKFSKRILITSLTLVLMVVALGVGVFAWFTMNTKTSASGLEGTAEAGKGGFYISLNGTGWSDTVSLTSVDSSFSVFSDLTTKTGDLAKLVDLEDDDANDADYIEFSLYFLGGSDNKNIYITGLTFENTADTSWIAEDDVDAGTREVEKGDKMVSNLSNAIRISIQDANSPSSILIFEKAADTPNFDDSGGTTKTFYNTIGFEDDGGNNFAVNYYNTIMAPKSVNLSDAPNRTDNVVEENDPLTYKQVAVLSETVADGTTGDGHGFDPSFTNYGEIIIRVWVEGWDQEAFNAVLNGTIKINFQFDLIQD